MSHKKWVAAAAKASDDVDEALDPKTRSSAGIRAQFDRQGKIYDDPNAHYIKKIKHSLGKGRKEIARQRLNDLELRHIRGTTKTPSKSQAKTVAGLRKTVGEGLLTKHRQNKASSKFKKAFGRAPRTDDESPVKHIETGADYRRYKRAIKRGVSYQATEKKSQNEEYEMIDEISLKTKVAAFRKMGGGKYDDSYYADSDRAQKLTIRRAKKMKQKIAAKHGDKAASQAQRGADIDDSDYGRQGVDGHTRKPTGPEGGKYAGRGRRFAGTGAKKAKIMKGGPRKGKMSVKDIERQKTRLGGLKNEEYEMMDEAMYDPFNDKPIKASEKRPFTAQEKEAMKKFNLAQKLKKAKKKTVGEEYEMMDEGGLSRQLDVGPSGPGPEDRPVSRTRPRRHNVSAAEVARITALTKKNVAASASNRKGDTNVRAKLSKVLANLKKKGISQQSEEYEMMDEGRPWGKKIGAEWDEPETSADRAHNQQLAAKRAEAKKKKATAPKTNQPKQLNLPMGEAVSVDGRTKGYRDAISRIASRHKVIADRTAATEIPDDTVLPVDEANKGTIARSVRKGTGPYTAVVVDRKGKVADQEHFQHADAAPAFVSELKKRWRDHKIHIEDKGGSVVYNESVDEEVKGTTRKMGIKAGKNPGFRAADSKDTELNDFLKNVSSMIGRGAKPDEVRAAIHDILPLMKKRGVKVTPQQKAALKKLGIKEEVEMVDELSKELLQRFSDKSYDARQKAMSLAARSSRGVDREQGRDELAAKKFKANQAKYANKAEKHRKAGRLAKDKIDGQAWVKRKANEEVEMIDELSTKTLASYIKKHSRVRQRDQAWAISRRERNKRKGIERAVDKLAKRSDDARADHQWRPGIDEGTMTKDHIKATKGEREYGTNRIAPKNFSGNRDRSNFHGSPEHQKNRINKDERERDATLKYDKDQDKNKGRSSLNSTVRTAIRSHQLKTAQKKARKAQGFTEEVEMVDEGGLGGGTKSNVTKTGTHSSNLNYITKSKKQGWSDRGRSSAPEKKRASKESRRAGKKETEVDEEIKVKMVKTIPPRKSTVERDKYLSLTKAQKIALARKKKTEVDEAKLRIPKETGTPGMTKASGPMTPYEKSKAFIAAHKRDNKGKHPTQAQHDKAIKEDETVGAQNVITKYKKRAADAKQWKKDNGKTSLGIEETANVGDKNAPVTSQDMDYLSDFYKDVYGTRPRGVYKNIKTVGDYQAEIESLSKAAKDQQNQVKQDRINQKKEKATEKKIQRKRTFGPKGGTQKTTLGPAFKKALAKSRSGR